MDRFEVAVAGAGIIGSAVAYECARRGAPVILLDALEPGRGASGAAAGILAPASELAGSPALLAAGRRSLAEWSLLATALEEETSLTPELLLTGVMRLATGPAEAETLRAATEAARRGGDHARWLEADEVECVEPAAAGGWGASWHADEGHVSGPAAVRSLVAAAARRGAVVRSGAPVVGAAPGGGVVLASGEAISARAVVVCAGCRSAEVASALGGPPLPVRPVRGQLLALAGVAPAPRAVLFGGLTGYAVTKADGRVLVGATEEDAGFDAGVTPSASAHLAGVARRLLRGAAGATAVSEWAGLRPRTPDGLPLLGRLGVTNGADLFVAAGHHRNGILLAPETGWGMAELILDGRGPAGWEAFDPARTLHAGDGAPV